ncbi:MAG: anthranilate phosphoribosyltransferase [Rikenellaceae bacterium]
MKKILSQLFEYESLSVDQARELFLNIANGAYNQAQLASLITVFLMRNISLEELDGFRSGLLELAQPLDFGTHDYIDIVGTGGDGKDTFNVSSCASVVVASAGYKVVKHGNYAASSVSGASNVMENHGVRFSNDNDLLRRSLDESNLVYLHAPVFNSAMRAVAEVRRNLGIRSFFNMLGPMINPASPRYQLLGVYNLAMQRLYCYMFQKYGKEFSVVHSLDGYDEISLTSAFRVSSTSGEKIYQPEDLGFERCAQSALYGGATTDEAARIFSSVLDGSSTVAQRDCVVANAGFAINVIEAEKSIEECLAIAREAISSGRALQTFKRFVAINS